jgi:zinc transport system substrate-binding protein
MMRRRRIPSQVRFSVSALMLAALAAAGGSFPPAYAEQAPAASLRLVASFYPIYIEALNVVQGVPGVELINLAPPATGCLHDYQMTTADMVKLAGASALIVNGAGMESFLDKVKTFAPGMRVIPASEGVTLIRNGQTGETNPHVWLSVTSAIRQVENIAAGLAALDPARAEAYRANARVYTLRLAELRERMHAALKGVRRRDIITFHEAFPYFAREFGLNVVAVIEREPGSEPSARELADTIRLVRRSGVKALFAEPQYPAASVRLIAGETGATVYKLDPAVTGPLEADAYLRIMETNCEVLKKALAQ